MTTESPSAHSWRREATEDTYGCEVCGEKIAANLLEGYVFPINGTFCNRKNVYGTVTIDRATLETSTGRLEDVILKVKRCECGARACRSNLHSDWCPAK